MCIQQLQNPKTCIAKPMHTKQATTAGADFGRAPEGRFAPLWDGCRCFCCFHVFALGFHRISAVIVYVDMPSYG